MSEPMDVEGRGAGQFRRRALLAAAGLPAIFAGSQLVAGVAVADPAEPTADQAAGLPAVTLADLRQASDPPEASVCMLVDPGMEGIFRFDPADTTSADNTGTVVVSASGARFKRSYSGALNVKWFGAVGDGHSDDTEAIQSAVSLAQSLHPGGVSAARGSVYIPPGYFRVTSPIILNSSPYGIRVFGAGPLQTWIGPHSSATELEAVFKFADTGLAQYFEFSDMYLIGNNDGVRFGQYGIYSAKIVETAFRRLHFGYFLEAGLGIGYGWINNVEDCIFTNNTDGVRSVADDLNMLNIVNCNFGSNTGCAINIRHSGENVRIVGCTIEGSADCAVNVQGVVQNLEIVGNYFELNATAGHQLAQPDQLIRAYVIINGGGSVDAVSSEYPPGAIRVADNFVSLDHVAEPAYFVACFASFGALELTSNTIADNRDAPKTDVVLLTGTSQTGGGARVDNLYLRGNGKSWSQPQASVKLDALTVQDLAGAATELHTARIDGVYRTNYAAPLMRFAPVSRPAQGTWRKAAGLYRQNEVWQLGGDEAAGAWGFSLSLDDNPHLAGRYVYFAVWTKASAVDTGLVLETSQLGPNTSAYAADTDWHVASYVDKMPETGTVTFSVAKISNGNATSTVSVAGPVLAEVGAPFVDFA